MKKPERSYEVLIKEINHLDKLLDVTPGDYIGIFRLRRIRPHQAFRPKLWTYFPNSDITFANDSVQIKDHLKFDDDNLVKQVIKEFNYFRHQPEGSPHHIWQVINSIQDPINGTVENHKFGITTNGNILAYLDHPYENYTWGEYYQFKDLTKINADFRNECSGDFTLMCEWAEVFFDKIQPIVSLL